MVFNKLKNYHLALLCLVLSYCSDDPYNKLAKNNFTLYSLENDNETESNIIGIKKESLNKEFLIQASLITQAVIPRFENLRSRIVRFKKIDEFIYMIESPDGHSATSGFSQKFVITRFPVTSVEKDAVFFDFVEGMNKVFSAGDWHASDFSGEHYNGSWDNLTIDVSYLEQRSFPDEEGIILEQVAQVNLKQQKGNTNIPVRVKYYIHPYHENKNFTSTKGTDFKHMGFFEISPRLSSDGKTTRFASKFDHKKQIKFYISNNTPKEYRQAIAEGITYWNKAFNYEALKAEIAPEGLQAPDFKHNIVQWVDWDDAGFAYADAQMDPRTGEILHAQVFLTSVFAVSSKSRAQTLLDRIKNQNKTQTNSSNPKEMLKQALHDNNTQKNPSISLTGFQTARLCDFHISEKFIDQLTNIISQNAEENSEKILKISKDYVREVVAHEIGHTLGLRHNFAGSLHANYPESTKNIIYKEYLKTGQLPQNTIPSSSVMDYQSFEESTMTGAVINSSTKALDYDQAAIDTLYKNKKHKRSQLPFYCTDSHIGKFLDCNVFDTGRELINTERETSSLNNLAHIIADKFLLGVKLKNEGKIYSLEQVLPKPTIFAITILANRLKSLRALEERTPLIKVRRSVSVVSQINKPFVKILEKNYIAKEFKKVGGVEAVFRKITEKEIKRSYKQFTSIIEQENYVKHTTFDGESINVAREDLEKIKLTGKLFFNLLASAFDIAELIVLDQAQNLTSNSLSNDLKKVMHKKTAEILFSHKTITINEGSEEKTRLPIFNYSHEIRLLASNLLKDRHYDNEAWGLKEKKHLQTILKTNLKAALGQDIFKIDLTTVSTDVANWIIQNKEIINNLDI
jgi:hypothetical protein